MPDTVLTPTRRVLDWAAEAAGGLIEQVEPLGLMGTGWLLRRARADPLYLRLGDPHDELTGRRIRTEAAALALAETHGVPVPHLVAVDLDGHATGTLALIRTMLPGSSRIPRTQSRSRLRALGAACGRMAGIPDAASTGLPTRVRPIADNVFVPSAQTTPAQERLKYAADRIAATQPRSADVGLVHGDFWQGNTLWIGDVLSGVVDWDSAGIGPSGIDLGYLRLDVAIVYGCAAADHVLDGWMSVRGHLARDVAYWDVVAAVATPPDLAEWLPFWHDQGRADLDVRTITGRRDKFLRAALTALDRAGR
jgi:aminoglycoside phosphotransferase (APT) family kinase protein